MLVSDIISRVRNIAGDTDALQFTDDSIMAWINDAMREVASDNQLLQKSASQPTAVGTAEYALPADILKFHSVLYDGNDLRFVTMEQAKEEGFLTSDVGTPAVVWVWATKITLWPAPESVGTLKLIYTREPTEVTAPGDTPEIPNGYHMRLVDYCLAQVAQQDDDMQRYNLKMDEFRTGVQKLKDLPEWEDGLYPMIAVSSRDGWGAYYDEY